MTPARMPIEIGAIRGLMIVAHYNPYSDQSRYQVRAETSQFSDWFGVGTWGTFEEAMEEFKRWEELHKTQMEEDR